VTFVAVNHRFRGVRINNRRSCLRGYPIHHVFAKSFKASFLPKVVSNNKPNLRPAANVVDIVMTPIATISSIIYLRLVEDGLEDRQRLTVGPYPIIELLVMDLQIDSNEHRAELETLFDAPAVRLVNACRYLL